MLKQILISLKLSHHEVEAGVEGIGTETAIDSQSTEQQTDAEPLVVYGKPEDGGTSTTPEDSTATVETSQDTAKEVSDADKRAEAWKQLREENKDLYEADLKSHLGQRLKGKDKEIGAMKSALDPLMAYLGKDSMEELIAFVHDEILPQVEDADSYRELLQANMNQDDQGATANADAEVELDMAVLNADGQQLADKLKAYDIDFQLPVELNNEDFKYLLNVGLTVEQAYNVLHHDDIIVKASQKAAQAEKKAVIETIKAKGINAVSESATKSTRPVVYKDDPNTWSDAEFDAVTKRALMGDTIRL